MCKTEYMSMWGHPSGKLFEASVPCMGKEKVMYFFAVRVGFQVCFLEISQRRHVRDIITT